MDLYQLRVILAFFLLEVFVSQTGAEAKAVCNQISYPSSSISLECNTNEWIHVKSVTFGQGNPDQGCVDKSKSCSKTQNSNENGLVVTCNGQMTCNEYIQVLSSTFSCPNVSGIEIEYECIKGSGPLHVQCDKGILNRNTSNNVTPFTSAPLTDIISQQSTSDSSSTASRETETNASPVSTSSGTFPTSGMSTSTSTDMDTADTSSAATTDHASSSSSIATNTTNDGSTDDINIAAIVGGLCGVILLLLVIISLLVYFKVIKPTRNHPSAQKTDIRNEQDMTVSYAHYEDVIDMSDSPTHDGALEVSRHTSNPYDDLSQYENHGVHDYGQLHLYEGAETRVEPSQDNRTYSGLSNYVNHGDHHNYGEIRRNN